ncbi:MAG: dihydroneopterin aldolase [Luminiphilus sp.]|jgi:dihydroneopterin aldolase|nr:dihydroneopterin aldolase [Pseudomonadales bacterium]MBL6901598.1 dihydroneopterin aldolase [Luminiphilus sp.]
MKGIVRIRGLQPEAVIGCYDWERTIKQRLSIDLDLTTDFKRAAQTDDLEHALDYAAIAAEVMTFVGESQFELLEALSKAIADQLFERWPISQVTVCIDKPGAVSTASVVGVTLTLSRGE